MPWWCDKHEQHSIDDMCSTCLKEIRLEKAAGKLFAACEQARNTIRHIHAIQMSATIELIKQRLGKVERACDKAIQLALTGE